MFGDDQLQFIAFQIEIGVIDPDILGEGGYRFGCIKGGLSRQGDNGFFRLPRSLWSRCRSVHLGQEAAGFVEELEEFGAVAVGVAAFAFEGELADLVPGQGAAIAALAEHEAVGGDGGGELELGAGGGEGGFFVGDGDFDELAGGTFGGFVAEFDGEEFGGCGGGFGCWGCCRWWGLVFEGIDGSSGWGEADGDEFVEGGDAMASADFASVFGVVIEVFFGEQAVFVTDEAVAGDLGGVEFDLDFDVFGDGDEGAGHLFDEDFASLAEAVDVAVVAVAFVGEGFHGAVFEVAGAVAEHAEEDAGAGFLGDEFFEFLRGRDADVEVAIGAEDDAVDAFGDEAGDGLFVSELDAGAAVGGTAGGHVGDGG